MKKVLFSSLLAAFMLSSVVAKEYSIDKSHTDLGFKIKHMGISNVKGNFKDYEGLVNFENGEFKKATAKIRVASIDTDSSARDKHLQQDDFFKAKAHPEITFEMTKYEKISNESGKMTGNLTMAGVTKEITLNAEIGGTAKGRDGKEKMGFSLSGKINRLDFKVGEKSAMLGDEINLQIEVEANEK